MARKGGHFRFRSEHERERGEDRRFGRRGMSWREEEEDRRFGGGPGGEPYRQGYYESEDTGNWSPYGDRSGFPGAWSGGERGGRMGWPRYGQGHGAGGEGYEWGGGDFSRGGSGRGYRSSERRRDYGQAGSWGDDYYGEPSPQRGGGGEGRGFGRGYRGGYGGGQSGDEMARRMGEWWHHEQGEDVGREAGPYRGRGPRGYTRSDERIREDVNDVLSDDPYLDASDIEVSVENGEVVLIGFVDSRQNKRRAEDLAESVSGIKNCQNSLRVRTGEEAEGETRRQGAGRSAAASASASSAQQRSR